MCDSWSEMHSCTGIPILLPLSPLISEKVENDHRERDWRQGGPGSPWGRWRVRGVSSRWWVSNEVVGMILYEECQSLIQGGFFNWPSPEFAKCGPVSNWFKKNRRVPDWPPLIIEKKSKCLVILILRRFRGGPVEGFMGGASVETFSGEGQLKKPPCILKT